MMTIGLTGSIAMGKSEVAKILIDEGIPVFDADREVHALYDSSEGAKLLQSAVPEAVIDGRVDRTKLSSLVMNNKQLLPTLESVVHAEIAKHRQHFTQQAEIAGHSIIVFDIPLLFEKGGEKDVDVTIVVSAPETIQRQRALARPGMTPEKLEMILARQMPDSKKRKRADHIIENNGTLEQLRQRTLAVLSQIRKAHAL
jgi:dephospho-CoA kinase